MIKMLINGMRACSTCSCLPTYLKDFSRVSFDMALDDYIGNLCLSLRLSFRAIFL
ncbi:hypothetical protein DN37_1756 [Vibrio cholerae]|nr:hypothetical protein DN37_1756 [Vibrio cholerae]